MPYEVSVEAAQPDVASRAVSLGHVSGWLHEGRGDSAVVLLGPHGFEGLCAQQTVRVMADMIAASGPDVLRIDFPGEGDSLDIAPGQDIVSQWSEAITTAVAWLKRERGARSLSAVGFRLGGLFALEAARLGVVFERLALVAPPASGRLYGRELSATARLFAATKLGCAVSEDGIELFGFQTTADQLRSLSLLGAAKAVTPPARQVLLAEPAERPCDRIADLLAECGGKVERLRFDGYGDMIAAPTLAKPPFAMLEVIAGWLGENATAVAKPALSSGSDLHGDGFVEEKLRFGRGSALAGVLCRPEHQMHESPTLVTLNAGGICHVGWARASVSHARALARLGHASFRMDLSGIGDSTWSRSGARSLFNSRQHIADTVQALDYLSGLGLGTFHLHGLCSGGYVALHTAHQDHRVRGVVPVNIGHLVWHDHFDIDAIESEPNQSSSAYASQAFSGQAWKRILSGDVSAQRVVAILRLLASKAAQRVIDPVTGAFGLETGLGDDDIFIRGVFQDLSKRGVSTRLIYSEGDPGLDRLDLHMGVGGRFLNGLEDISVETIVGADHEFTPQSARDLLLQILLQSLSGASRDAYARAS